jgi:glucokinase
MNYKKKYFTDQFNLDDFSYFLLGADVGGTNTNLCIAGVKNKKPLLLFSFHFKTKELSSLNHAVNEILTYAKYKYNMNITTACISAAGIISEDETFVSLTNANWHISSEELKKDTSLEIIYLINDFQAIGYGINLLNPFNENDFFILNPSQVHKTTDTKVVIGAGTGLGKSILVYNNQFDAYLPIPSEGGHTDFPIYTPEEQELCEYVKKIRHISQPLPYEELLSGRGLEAIYQFLSKQAGFKSSDVTKEIDAADEKAVLISKYRTIDETCKQTFSIFAQIYGRCAKNFVLDTLAEGGLYIAGGIAAKNQEIFTNEEFFEEFTYGYRREDFLKSVPIFIIRNYDISLYGTCFAAVYFQHNKE